ncbi:hypothetical protein BLOT_009342, partial [Blomia tropicalis]
MVVTKFGLMISSKDIIIALQIEFHCLLLVFDSLLTCSPVLLVSAKSLKTANKNLQLCYLHGIQLFSRFLWGNLQESGQPIQKAIDSLAYEQPGHPTHYQSSSLRDAYLKVEQNKFGTNVINKAQLIHGQSDYYYL